MPKSYYITTPIYYVNSVPHAGTTLTTLCADMLARYKRMQGFEVKMLTGTDENGFKVFEAAQAAGKDPMNFVDEISQSFRDVFDKMGFEYDFIRTTEPRHKDVVWKIFETLKEAGHVYQGQYEGWYDVSSETFYKETDLVDGKSPDGNEVRWVSETNWFFRLSAFADKLLAHFEANPEFFYPQWRSREVISFIEQGLRDMCISRKNAGWGIPVPGDEEQVFYVWFDALVSYIAATGWPDATSEQFWPADVHMMAKEIFVRFHATLWPAMLMGANLPLPKHILVHDWFVFGDSKMSKSLGNVLAPLQLALEIADKSGCTYEVGIDVVRFALARLMPYSSDTNFTRAEVDKHYNADLANDIGNGLNRTLAMAHKFVDGVVQDVETDPEVLTAIQKAKSDYESAMNVFAMDQAMEAACGLVRYLNKYIDVQAPWDLAKNKDPKISMVMRSMLMLMRSAEGMFAPCMPHCAQQISTQLGLSPINAWSEIGTESSLPAGTKLSAPEPIFPRIDKKKMQDQQTPTTEPKPEPKPKTAPTYSEITIEDFMKIQLRVARVLEAEAVEGSSKLVKLQVIVGDERRQILAGIQKSYAPQDLVGRQIIVVANLKPAKLMGHESQGMVLAADGPDGTAILLTPEQESPEGTSVH